MTGNGWLTPEIRPCGQTEPVRPLASSRFQVFRRVLSAVIPTCNLLHSSCFKNLSLYFFTILRFCTPALNNRTLSSCVSHWLQLFPTAKLCLHFYIFRYVVCVFYQYVPVCGKLSTRWKCLFLYRGPLRKPQYLCAWLDHHSIWSYGLGVLSIS